MLKREVIVDFLDAFIESTLYLASRQDWKEYLEFEEEYCPFLHEEMEDEAERCFPQYTKLSTKESWESLGYRIKNDEIPLLLPYNSASSSKAVMSNFEVYDISQTYPSEWAIPLKPKPDFPPIVPHIEEEEQDRYFTALASYCKFELGFKIIKDVKLSGMDAHVFHDLRQIEIGQECPKEKMLLVLLHEIAHTLFLPAALWVSERDAETTATVICAMLGIDCFETSSAYLFKWRTHKYMQDEYEKIIVVDVIEQIWKGMRRYYSGNLKVFFVRDMSLA